MAKQEGRLLSIKTALGEDFLLLNKLTSSEGISQLYSIEVELLHDSEKESNKPETFDIKSILGQAATVSVTQRDGGARFFNGIFKSMKLAGRVANYSFYYAAIVPQVWELTQIVQSRIFQQKSVRDILLEVFSKYQIKLELQWSYEPRNYCVQYNESDFDFVSRLMEEEGICYYFEFSSTAETMVITDNFQSPRDCPNKCEIGIYNEDLSDEIFESSVKEWSIDYKLQSGKVTLWDYNFQLPKKKLEVQQTSRVDVGGNRQMEIYKFSAGFARKYDGVSKDGGDQSGELNKIFTDNQQTVKDEVEMLDAGYMVSDGESDCCTFTPGYRFHLNNHPNSEYNLQYTLVSVNHEIDQHPNFLTEKSADNTYSNYFTCIPHGSGKPEFRSPLKTPKPIVCGSQTAIVVGPSGEEIFTDKFGRVKVQFHWDRYGKVDASSSCWVRVAQTWAGNKWGAMFIPRIGMEVLVHFLEGDPDQPIITGCVYNADSMPPYSLPNEKTKSTLKTNSSSGGGGFNEFRIEDKKGSEQIFVHGEKNLDIRIKNDAMEIVKNDRHLIVESNQYEKVKSDKHLEVTGDHNEKIGGGMSLNVGGDLQIKTGPKFAVNAASEIHLKSGMSLTIETGTNLTLKVGGNFININPGGVFIKGTMVMINSGGAAGSGGGSSPTAPTAPKEADTANPGDKIKSPASPPPTTSRNRSQKSAAMQSASENGTPFVSNEDSSPKPDANQTEPKKEAKEESKKTSPTDSTAPQAQTKPTPPKKKSFAEKVKSAVEKVNKALSEKKKEIEKKVDEKIGKAVDFGKDLLEKKKEIEQEVEKRLDQASDVKKGIDEAKNKAEEALDKLKKLNPWD